MNTTHNLKTKRLIAALGAAAAAAVTPALLFLGAGTAHADCSSYDASCSPVPFDFRQRPGFGYISGPRRSHWRV